MRHLHCQGLELYELAVVNRLRCLADRTVLSARLTVVSPWPWGAVLRANPREG